MPGALSALWLLNRIPAEAGTLSYPSSSHWVIEESEEGEQYFESSRGRKQAGSQRRDILGKWRVDEGS